MHMKVGDTGGYVTAAIAVDGDAARFGLAFCVPGDQFSRKRGRVISEGRLRVGKDHAISLVAGQRVKSQVAAAIKELVKAGQAPWWAQEAIV